MLLRYGTDILLTGPAFRVLDPQNFLIHVRVVRPHLFDSFLLCAINVVLVTISLVVQNARLGTDSKVIVPGFRNVHLAHVTHDAPTLAAGHLVAADLLDDGQSAPGTFSDQRLAHGFFDQVSRRDAFFLLVFFTRHGNVRLLVAEATADLLAFWIEAPEFLVHLDGRTDGFVLAEWTAAQTVQTGFGDLVLLLQRLQLLHDRRGQHFRELAASKARLAATGVETDQFVLHQTDLGVGRSLDALVAEEVGFVAVAGHGSVRGNVGVTTAALHKSAIASGDLFVAPLRLFELFLLPEGRYTNDRSVSAVAAG